MVIVIEEAADSVLTAPADEIQRLLYGFSLLICLPDSLAHTPSAATGAVMRPATLSNDAQAAGFTGAEPLNVTHTAFWTIDRLGC